MPGSWQPARPGEVQAGERRRGPMRSIVWAVAGIRHGQAAGARPGLRAGRSADPADRGALARGGTSRMQGARHAGGPEAGSAVAADRSIPSRVVSISRWVFREAAAETGSASSHRTELTQSQTLESFDRLADVVVQRTGDAALAIDPTDPLLAAAALSEGSTRGSSPLPSRLRRISDLSSRSPARRVCGFAAFCCATSGGSTMSDRWWPGTARNAIRWRSSAAATAATR